ncbi:major facilitator superfamily domain-containing protein [Leucosporidium creatinivorum]|uniref:Major facilitator superfamily domain-containing protein n=1 Tax=Leucosporidium creatinivorum TaxID=106004 RepID=A0A1Y2FXX5_9BASI|nr:major facilitator superfamily domain-containing protein [Leucosporidium creatinivorum]
MSPTTPPAAPSTASTGSTTSSATLAHQQGGTTVAASNTNGALKPEPLRTFKTPNADEHGEWLNDDEEAEREFASFGGDVPDAQAMPRRTRTRRNTSGSRTRSRSDSLPGLHLVDSAYSESHRVMSRISRQEAEDRGEEAPAPPAADPNKVVWAENDPDNPQNWSVAYKWWLTALCSFLTISVTFASSAPSSATRLIAADFGTSTEVAILTTSMFLCGYILGPILWAPISEIVGRRPVFIGTMFCFALCEIGDALGKNIETIVIMRLLAGTFAASPLTNCGGVIADTWDAVGRGNAMSVFSASVFIGPVIGPIIGGFVSMSYLGWRWIFWIMGIWALLCASLVVLFLPETYHPKLLAKRAKKLRKENPETNKDLYADLERADFSFKSIVTRTIARPFVMLATEPILMLVTIYLSIIYGLLYALFSVFPIIWESLRGFNAGESGLIFIGVGIGTTLGAILNMIVQRHYRVLVPRWHGHPPPEERLYGAMLAGPFLIIGVFWLGWTGNYASVHWAVPAVATIFIGMSFTLVFISFLSYLIEVYLMYSASALAANTILRSAFTSQMFARLGVNWACTLIGCIALLIAPSPFIFYKFGPRIRGSSKFAPCLDIAMRERVEREMEEEKGRRKELV